MIARGSTFFLFFLLVLTLSARTQAAQWYIRTGAGIDWSHQADFHDRDPYSANPPALFGPGPGSDGRRLGAYGDFGRFAFLEGAVGIQPLSWLRTDLSLTYRPGMDYHARANFINVPGEQPVSAEAESWAAMVNLFLEITNLVRLDLGAFLPYVGGGLGLSYNHTGHMTYYFPELTKHRVSITPSGSRVDLAYMACAGTGIRLSKKFVLDISYRYSDLGRVETAPGNMFMDSLPAGIEIAETSASLRTHGFLVQLRYHF